MSAPIRIGTRASLLATTQSELVADADPRPARPRGRAGRDHHRGRPQPGRRHAVEQVGGTGVFVSALRDALLDGEVDVAVHSLKDLPTAPPTGSRSPPCPRARTRATSSSPATA